MSGRRTAFNTPSGPYKPLAVPFGLTNAPGVFQACINDLLREFLNVFVFAYLNNILIFSRSLKEHVSHVSQVLQRLLVNKSSNKTSVSFLGFTISLSRIEMESSKVKAVLDWSTPTLCQALQWFLGFANFYRRFIKGYSTLATNLTALTSTVVPFQWNALTLKAFSNLKQQFCSAPILTIPDCSLKFVVKVDASEIDVEVVLTQRSGQDNKVHPCSFFSTRLTPTKQNYHARDHELLAIKFTLDEWRHWLEGTTTTCSSQPRDSLHPLPYSTMLLMAQYEG